MAHMAVSACFNEDWTLTSAAFFDCFNHQVVNRQWIISIYQMALNANRCAPLVKIRLAG